MTWWERTAGRPIVVTLATARGCMSGAMAVEPARPASCAPMGGAAGPPTVVVFRKECRMIRFWLVVASLALASPVWAAQPIALHARTSGDLAALCAADQGSPGADA